MNSKNFCRILHTSTGEQILLIKDYDTEDEKDELQVIFSVDREEVYVTAKISMHFDNPEDRNQAFEDFSQEEVDGLHKAIQKQTNQLFEKES